MNSIGSSIEVETLEVCPQFKSVELINQLEGNGFIHIETKEKESPNHFIEDNNYDKTKSQSKEADIIKREEWLYYRGIYQKRLKDRELFKRRCKRCGEFGHLPKECKNEPKFKEDIIKEIETTRGKQTFRINCHSKKTINQQKYEHHRKLPIQKFQKLKVPINCRYYCDYCREYGHKTFDCPHKY
ncbi:hypothetical protein ENUP19_0247G0015 [Entamoeba nuttalli]|uniref:Zinc knuckle domain containing protein n=2 Tax=Entamoeba nuttalli TaxID=412467 RepID=K2HN51_ENTNP|nr:zinc knuckle domain containing protein [Entamoeba nuttalli P19]EKE37255.1 zinc knuckle domain containing protein [Entamoeba nuttalli P19]|eukprot:XP_008860413.1 zinc knuckle domain containing protein [Entamoeba nuttalli P19]